MCTYFYFRHSLKPTRSATCEHYQSLFLCSAYNLPHQLKERFQYTAVIITGVHIPMHAKYLRRNVGSRLSKLPYTKRQKQSVQDKNSSPYRVSKDA